jgi:hypothetical protein
MNLEVQMGASTAPSAAHLTDDLTLIHLLPFLNEQSAVVGVPRHRAVLVDDLNQEAITSIVPTGKADPASLNGDDGCSNVVGDINAFVHAPPAPAVT